jgi:photosystem II stability/assembly factor-like uncharacterized protein
LLSIGKGEASRIYQTADGGQTWTLRFKTRTKMPFFDALAFWDRQHGLAMSDPVNGRFLIVATDDGGKTWQPVPGDKMPPALDRRRRVCRERDVFDYAREAECLVVTGGKTARVFRSTDRGAFVGSGDGAFAQ